MRRNRPGNEYYRYDLEDGTSMVVKVYHARIFDGYASGSYEAQYHDGYGRHEYYLLRDGKFFRDCDMNRSLLIEKLKEIQKVKKAVTRIRISGRTGERSLDGKRF
ncbi:MAG: hypothetical protein ACLTCQ_19790 [Enterocloster bolteae]